MYIWLYSVISELVFTIYFCSISSSNSFRIHFPTRSICNSLYLLPHLVYSVLLPLILHPSLHHFSSLHVLWASGWASSQVGSVFPARLLSINSLKKGPFLGSCSLKGPPLLRWSSSQREYIGKVKTWGNSDAKKCSHSYTLSQPACCGLSRQI